MDIALLDGMHHATGAGHRSGDRRGCLRGTRTDVLLQIEYQWLKDARSQPVFWLNGLAGTGKSAIAQTFAEISFAEGRLGASFFCSRDFEDRSNIQNVFPTLAFQLAYQYPEFRKELLPVLKANPEVERESLYSQLEKLIIAPLKATGISTLIIIDAIDECRDKERASAVLSALSRYMDRIPLVKFFITSRPEPRIRAGFRLEGLQPITEVLKLHEVGPSSVDSDIRLFFRTQLDSIAKTQSDFDLTEIWPSSHDIDILCEKSAGFFSYASAVVEFVASQYDHPTERLALITSLPQSTAHEGESGIDFLYTQTLEQAFHGVRPGTQEFYTRFKLVGAVLLAFYPLSKRTLLELFKNRATPSHISNALRSLHSLLLIPESEADPIRAFHKSFPDFLTDPERCSNERFFIDPPVHHTNILFLCLDLMKERLRKNICNLNGCPLLSDVKDLPDRKKACIGDALEYACQFWTKHLLEIPRSGPHIKRVKAAIDEFFTTHLLFWIEVLSLINNLGVAVYALRDVDQWFLSVSCVGCPPKHTLTYVQTRDSCGWTNDSQRLILSNFDRIRDSPASISCYILPFCPSSSWLHKWYPSESLREVRVATGRPDKWDICARVVPFHDDANALACREDTIAVGLVSGEIIILDAVIGSTCAIFSGPQESVTSLAFSLDGTVLVSGRVDGAFELWDIQTGGIVKSFQDDGLLYSVSISQDAIAIASGSTNSIRLWDVRTGMCYNTIYTNQKSGGVTCLDFPSTIPGHLVSVSGGLVQQWDISSSEAGPPTPGNYIAFSSDGKRFVLCDEGPPTIRDTVSETIIATLHSPGHDFSRCCFSPSNEFVAGVADTTVYVWDVTDTPRLIETIPHDSSICSLVYSSSLISIHQDGTVKLQWIYGDSPDSTPKNAKPAGPPRAKIVYTAMQAEEGVAISVDSAGTVERWDLSTGLPKPLLQIPETKTVGGVQLVDGVLAIVHGDQSFSSGWGVSVWNVEAKERLRETPLSGDPSILDPTPNRNLGISEDGTTFFVVDPEEIRTWSTLTGKSTGSVTHHKYTSAPTPLSIDLDGPRIWIRSLGKSPAYGWDLGNLEPSPLDSSKIPYRLRLACLQDKEGALGGIASSRIIDTTSQTEVFRLPQPFARPGKAVWDGRYLFVVYETGEPLILDFANMTLPVRESGKSREKNQGLES